MKKGQSVLMYGIIMLILGVIMFTSIFLLSDSIHSSGSEELTYLNSNTILAKVENKILDMKTISEHSNTNVETLMDIPEKIGKQHYSIVGYNDRLKIRILSENPSNQERKLGLGITASGVSFPPTIHLFYNLSTNSVTIK